MRNPTKKTKLVLWGGLSYWLRSQNSIDDEYVEPTSHCTCIFGFVHCLGFSLYAVKPYPSVIIYNWYPLANNSACNKYDYECERWCSCREEVKLLLLGSVDLVIELYCWNKSQDSRLLHLYMIRAQAPKFPRSCACKITLQLTQLN